ncbi:hypothetical protein H6A18_09460 [Collinsella tanakaei]|uniref:hypothetical protein n=1 Tax=Collinsella tanakaei TaxID=626935 RepID=UPI00195D892E|nr:hypothetical protein [Collinsella tanakaei]MBM6756728.1 hypothetical protein [Collinsella tanakaei]
MTENQPGNRNCKPVIDDTGRHYESAADAARAIGCAPRSIRNSIWKGTPCRGQLFRYEGEQPRERKEDGPRDGASERRGWGGRAAARKRWDKQVDSYLPVRSYSPERVRPWEM